MYKFREIINENELEKFMHLRYKTYAESVNQDFIKKNNQELDIDIYDIHSKHFGLFYDNEPVGAIRLVHHKSEIFDERAYNIGLKNGVFAEDFHSKENILKYDYPDFPFISNKELPESIRDFYNNVNEKEFITEGSRLILVGKHKGLSLARFLVESTIAYSVFCKESTHSILNCNSSHQRFYKQYGFENIDADKEYFLKGRVDKSSSVLSLSKVGNGYEDKFNDMANQFITTQSITRSI